MLTHMPATWWPLLPSTFIFLICGLPLNLKLTDGAKTGWPVSLVSVLHLPSAIVSGHPTVPTCHCGATPQPILSFLNDKLLGYMDPWHVLTFPIICGLLQERLGRFLDWKKMAFMRMSDLPTRMYVRRVCLALEDIRRGCQITWTWSYRTWSCEPPCGCWEQNLGPLQEQQNKNVNHRKNYQ